MACLHVIPFFCMKKQSIIEAVAAVMLVIATLAYYRGYVGIRHDATLYVAQMLHVIDPSIFSNDLFFKYGSQANFTLFPHLAAFANRFFPDVGALWRFGGALSLLLYAAACAYTLSAWLQDSRAICLFAICLAIFWPGYYGHHQVITYAEPYFTARGLAEPLVICALGALIRRKFWLVGILGLLAAALHPLQAVPLAGILVIFATPERLRKFYLIGLVAGSFLLIGVQGAGLPWPGLVTYDEDWWDAVENSNGFVLLQQWGAADWIRLGLDFWLVRLARDHASARVQKVLDAVLWTAVLGFVVALLYADGLRIVLATGTQFWRAQWILHWCAVASFVAMMGAWARFDTSSFRTPPTRLIFLVAAFLLSVPIRPVETAYAALLCALLYTAWPSIQFRIGTPYEAVLRTAVVAAVVIIVVRHAFYIGTDESIALAGDDGSIAIAKVFQPVVAVGLFAAALVAWGRLTHFWRLPVMAAGTVLAIFLVLRWDGRAPETRLVESMPANPDMFGWKIEPDATVYWSNENLAPWLLLRRAVYLSGSQQGGLLFNRETALESYRRRDAIAPLELQAQLCLIFESIQKGAQIRSNCLPDAALVGDMCTMAGSTLQYVIFPGSLHESGNVHPVGSYVFRSVRGIEKTHYLYRCADLVKPDTYGH